LHIDKLAKSNLKPKEADSPAKRENQPLSVFAYLFIREEKYLCEVIDDV